QAELDAPPRAAQQRKCTRDSHQAHETAKAIRITERRWPQFDLAGGRHENARSAGSGAVHEACVARAPFGQSVYTDRRLPDRDKTVGRCDDKQQRKECDQAPLAAQHEVSKKEQWDEFKVLT